MGNYKRFIPQIVKIFIKNLVNIAKKFYYNLSLICSKTKDINLQKRIITENAIHCFFGYYDVNPFSDDEQFLLGMQTKTPLRTPVKGDIVCVGYYNLRKDDLVFNKFGETETWCWQQGCRLRWFPGTEQHAIYNTLVGSNYGAVVKNIKTLDTIEEYPFSLYDISANGEKGLTLNFSRLQRLRPGYGYGVLDDKTKDVNCPDNEGVWLTDLNSKRKVLLHSLKELAEIDQHETMKGAEHYINHISINPSGTSYLFLHLWTDKERGKRYSRLFTDNLEGGDLKLVNNTGYVSHYTWKTDEILVVFTWYGNKKRYCIYDKAGIFLGVLGEESLIEDGHPSFICNNNYMITDTYPNIARDQLLLLYKIKTNKVDVLNRFKVPENYTGEVRCDLHPRVSKDGRMICVDCVENNYRAMSVIDLKEVL